MVACNCRRKVALVADELVPGKFLYSVSPVSRQTAE